MMALNLLDGALASFDRALAPASRKKSDGLARIRPGTGFGTVLREVP
jgi:hypothetical protein